MLVAAFVISRSAVIFACGILAGAVGVQLRRQFEASIAAATARDYVTNLFGQHVSPQVVDRLLAAGSTTSSDARQVAVMFVDIRGFTAAARARTPQEVVDRLDAAFTVLVEIVDRNGGIVNKFLGDGFLALFGAPLDDPDAPRRAVTAAREASWFTTNTVPAMSTSASVTLMLMSISGEKRLRPSAPGSAIGISGCGRFRVCTTKSFPFPAENSSLSLLVCCISRCL